MSRSRKSGRRSSHKPQQTKPAQRPSQPVETRNREASDQPNATTIEASEKSQTTSQDSDANLQEKKFLGLFSSGSVKKPEEKQEVIDISEEVSRVFAQLVNEFVSIKAEFSSLQSAIESLKSNQQILVQVTQSAWTDQLENLPQKVKAALENQLASINSIQQTIDTLKDLPEANNKLSRLLTSMEDRIMREVNAMKSLPSDLERRSSSLNREIRQMEESSSKRLQEISESISEYRDINQGKLTSIERSFDLLQGKLEAIDQIQRTLTDKGISIRQEIPPAGEDEEVILQLAKYGQKTLELLTLAARHYARNREDIARAGQDKHVQELKEMRERSIEQGKLDGKGATIKKLIEQFTDLDELFNSHYPNDQVLVGFFKNNGLDRDEKLFQGQTIEISAADRMRFEPQAKFQGSGTFKVKKSCFKLGEDVIREAELEIESVSEVQGYDLHSKITPIQQEKLATNTSNVKDSGQEYLEEDKEATLPDHDSTEGIELIDSTAQPQVNADQPSKSSETPLISGSEEEES